MPICNLRYRKNTMLIYVTLIIILVCPERKKIVKLNSEKLIIKLLNCHEKLHLINYFQARVLLSFLVTLILCQQSS